MSGRNLPDGRAIRDLYGYVMYQRLHHSVPTRLDIWIGLFSLERQLNKAFKAISELALLCQHYVRHCRRVGEATADCSHFHSGQFRCGS